MEISIGRIVMFKLRQEDVDSINNRRGKDRTANGNPITVGEEYPMIVVCVWPNEFGPGVPGINGQVFLDGDDSHWITSVGEGTGEGQWRWPTLQAASA